MKSFMKKAVACGLVLALGCTSLAGCGKSKKIDGTKAVVTVNGEDLPLGVASFYAKYQQAYMYQLYMMYFGQASSIFDEVVDEESGKTYAEDMKDSVLEDLEKMMVISQHADEYGVALTDEQKAEIEAAAQSYIDSNEQSVLDVIGASKDNIAQLMTLQTIQSLMRDPIVKDVDREVSDEEAQQTTLTYVEVEAAEEEAAEEETAESEAAESEAAASEAAESEAATSEAAESEAAESVAAEVESIEEEIVSQVEEAVAEELTAQSEAASSVAAQSEAAASEAVVSEAAVSEAAESEAVESEAVVSEAAETETAASEAAETEDASAEAEPAEETEAQKAARADAQAILDAVMAESDIANADMNAIAQTVNESYYSSTGQFTTHDTSDTYLDANVVSSVEGLADGEVVDHVVVGENGSYYVVRLDHAFDEEATQNKKDDIVSERKETTYTETTDAWKEEAEITVHDDVWKLVTLKDSEPVTLKAKETAESEEEAAESTAESAVSEAESADSAAESAVSEAESVAGAAESAVSEAVSAAEEAQSAVESVAAEAEVESAAESAAAEAEAESEAAVSSEAAAETTPAPTTAPTTAAEKAAAAAAAEAAAAMESSAS